MKNILIPTDFSDNASDAMAYALSLLGESRAILNIVHVVPVKNVTTNVPIDNSAILAKEIEEANEAMNVLKEFSLQFFGDRDNAQIKINTEVAVGGAAYQIKKLANELEVDLIVMGTQGVNHSFVDKVLGSISTSTMDNAPCPIILVPADFKFKPIDNIIFATNLNHSDPYELWRATELIKPHVGKVRCVYVSKDQVKENKAELEQFAKYMVEHSPTIQTVFNVEVSDNIEKTLSEYAENYDAEMVIMHRSKNTFWKSLFGPRHTKKMASWLSIPLMIMDHQ